MAEVQKYNLLLEN